MDENVVDQTQNTPSIRQCWPLISRCDLDLQDRGLVVSHDMSYDYVEHLCQVISKFLHKWLSYGLETKCWTDGWSPFLCPTFFFKKAGDKNAISCYMIYGYHIINLKLYTSNIPVQFFCFLLFYKKPDIINIIISDNHIADLSIAFTLNTGKS